MFNDCPCHAVLSSTYMLSSDDLVHSAWSVKKCIIFPEIIFATPTPTPHWKKKLMQNSYHFQMHLAYILLMALFLWKFSAADLHWCSHGCSYYKIQGNKNVINKLIQTLKVQLYWNIYFRINNCTSLQKILPYVISVKEIFYWDSKRLKSNFVETALFLRCRLAFKFTVLIHDSQKNQCRYLNISTPRLQGHPQVFFNGLSIPKIISILTSNIWRAF